MDERPNPAGRRTEQWPRPPAAWAVGALVVLAGATLLAAGGGLAPGEASVLTTVNGLPRAVGLPLQVVMGLGTSVAAVALAGLAWALRRPRLALATFIAWGLGRATSAALKVAVDRPRPPGLLPDVHLRQGLPIDAGFPSAHTTTAVALAVVAGWAFPQLRAPAVGLAVLVALARLYVGVHLPLDLVGGAAIGLLAALVATAVVDRGWPAPARPGPPDP